jgi:hypothetical protein
MSTPLFGIMGKNAGVAAKTFLDGREARLLPRAPVTNNPVNPLPSG